MDRLDARTAAEQHLQAFPPIDDPVITDVVEYEQAFVVQWTSSEHLRTVDLRDAQGPGTGPLAVPKDGREPRFLGSQRLDVALHQAGLGPPPVERDTDHWG